MESLHIKIQPQLLNTNSQDLSEYTAPPPRPREWYCQSKKCCEYVTRTTEVFDKKTGEKSLYKFWGQKTKVLKLTQFTTPKCCPDCGEGLFLHTTHTASRRDYTP